jgi:hypothetical protein
VVRPLSFVFAAVVATIAAAIAAAIAAVIAAVIDVPLFRRRCWLVLSGAGTLVAVRPYLDVLCFLE